VLRSGIVVAVVVGVVGALLAIGSLRLRRLLAPAGAVVALLVGAVALFTHAKSGGAEPTASATEQTVVFAGEADKLAIGLAVTPHGKDQVELRATVLGFDGPADGLDVRFTVDGKSDDAGGCGKGCYDATLPAGSKPRSIAMQIAGQGNLRFAGPAEWPAPSGLEIVRHAEQEIGSLRTLVVHSRLASDAQHEVTTVYRMVAPNRLAFRNDDGAESVIIGTHRWDKPAGGKWTASRQFPPISQPAPFWGPDVTDAHVLRTTRVDGRPVWVVSFLDPSTPAWFTAWVDRSTYRTVRLEMVAVAHFMHDRDGPFDAPVSVQPPGT
jgi:hypothetical protein